MRILRSIGINQRQQFFSICYLGMIYDESGMLGVSLHLQRHLGLTHEVLMHLQRKKEAFFKVQD